MTVDPFDGVCAERLAPAPAHLFAAAREQFLRPPIASERRRSSRFLIAVEAVARPLADDGTPAGEPFRGVIADLSNGGLRMIHRERISAPLLAVRIGLWDDAVAVVVRVIRTAETESTFEYAGPFLEPLALTPLDVDGLRDYVFELATAD